VDIVVNNAGFAGTPGHTAEGIDLHVGAMHVGHWLLTDLVIARNKGGSHNMRVVNVASGTHHLCAVFGMDCLGPEFLESGFQPVMDTKKAFKGTLAALRHELVGGSLHYFQAKLANVLHALHLPKKHPGIQALSVDLGWVSTSIQPWMQLKISPFQLGFMRSASRGADPIVAAAAGPVLLNGGLVDPNRRQWAPFTVEERLGLRTRQEAEELATHLWEVTVRATKRMPST